MREEEFNRLRKLYRIKVVRIPANGGHFGNEQADELARWGSALSIYNVEIDTF